jgi:hypothetical protein
MRSTGGTSTDCSAAAAATRRGSRLDPLGYAILQAGRVRRPPARPDAAKDGIVERAGGIIRKRRPGRESEQAVGPFLDRPPPSRLSPRHDPFVRRRSPVGYHGTKRRPALVSPTSTGHMVFHPSHAAVRSLAIVSTACACPAGKLDYRCPALAPEIAYVRAERPACRLPRLSWAVPSWAAGFAARCPTRS